MTKLDECGLPPVNPLPHPTPQHIKGFIERRMMDANLELALYQAILAMHAGIKDACREHDEAQRK